MKTILVATDFSPASRSAAIYGAELAVRFNSRLILFNAYQPIPVDNAESMAILGSEEMKKITVKLLDHEVHFLKSRYSLPIEYGYAEGNISHSILSYAKETKTNLIIIGMKEFGKRFRKIFWNYRDIVGKTFRHPHFSHSGKCKIHRYRHYRISNRY